MCYLYRSFLDKNKIYQTMRMPYTCDPYEILDSAWTSFRIVLGLRSGYFMKLVLILYNSLHDSSLLAVVYAKIEAL